MKKLMVKLISLDKKEYLVSKEKATLSKLIKVLLNNPLYLESETYIIHLNIESRLLEIAIQYMEYKFKHYGFRKKYPDFDLINGMECELLEVSKYLQL